MEALQTISIEEAVALLRRDGFSNDEIAGALCVLKMAKISDRYRDAAEQYGVNCTSEQMASAFAEYTEGCSGLEEIDDADYIEIRDGLENYTEPESAAVVAKELCAVYDRRQLTTSIPVNEWAETIDSEIMDAAIEAEKDGLFEFVPIDNIKTKSKKAYIANQCADELVMRLNQGEPVHAKYSKEYEEGKYQTVGLAFDLLPPEVVYLCPEDDEERPYPLARDLGARVYVASLGHLRIFKAEGYTKFASDLTSGFVDRYGQYGTRSDGMLFFSSDTQLSTESCDVNKIKEHVAGLMVPLSILKLKKALRSSGFGRQVYLHSRFVRGTCNGIRRGKPVPPKSKRDPRRDKSQRKDVPPTALQPGDHEQRVESDECSDVVPYGEDRVRLMVKQRWPLARVAQEFKISDRAYKQYEHWKSTAPRNNKPAKELRKRLTESLQVSCAQIANIAYRLVCQTRRVEGQLCEQISTLLITELDGAMRFTDESEEFVYLL